MAQRLLERPEQREIPGVEIVQGRSFTIQRWVTVALTVLPFAAFILAVLTLWGRGLSMLDAGLALGFYAFSGLGITVGFHRLFSHKAFTARPAARVLLAVMGSMAVEGSIISWVATHRRHHAFSDKPGDPHSPHLAEEEGLRGTIKGLWYAHTGWLFDNKKTISRQWAPDLLKEERLVRVDRMFPKIAAISIILPGVLGLLITRSWMGGLTAYLWAGVARVFLLHHVTWSINSICHYFGTRPYPDVKDESRNNGWLAPFSFGESWHNNHHAYPSSARLGLRWYQVDPGWYLIVVMRRLRLITHVRPLPNKNPSG